MMKLKLFCTLGLWLAASCALAEDWPRFRGPNGSGVSESTVPISWTPTANLGWKAELPGAGVSSPIVVGNKVLVTCYSGYGLDRQNPGELKDLMRHVVCFAADSGEKLWQKDVPAAMPEDPYTGIGVTAHGYASHTPVSDGQNVYAFFGKGGVHAFTLDGEPLWNQSVGNESDPWKWGSSSSPIVFENILIVTASAESQAIVGLDTKTGKEVWRAEASGLDGMWGTPILATVGDQRTDLILSVPREVWGLNPKTGQLNWFVEASGADQTHSSPVLHDNKVFAMTGRGGGSVAVEIGSEPSASAVSWNGRDTARFGSPIEYDNRLYLVANNVLTVIDPDSGERLGRARLEGGSSGGGRFGSSDYASPIIAGNHLYHVNSKGQTFVFSLGDSPEQLSLNLVTTEDETFGGTPAVSEGKLFLRSDQHLYCVVATGQEVAANASADLIASLDSNPSPEGPGGPGGLRGGPQRGGPPQGGGRQGGGAPPQFNPATFFNRLDQDSDGKLTEEEVEETPLAQQFATLDENKDGGVTLEEFQAGMRNATRGRGGFGGGQRGGGRGGFGGPGGEDNRPKRPQRPPMADA